MTIIFSNSPFDKEVRFDCQKVKMNTEKFGEICILPNYRDTIFDINNSTISVLDAKNTEVQMKITNSAIVKVKNNIVNVFGQFQAINND